METTDISVVIPVYNSSSSIEELIGRIIKSLKELCSGFEIILVDDCSKDNSLDKLKSLKNKYDQVKIISLKENHGQQAAIKIGIEQAKGDYIVTMDDDLEHQPEDIRLLLEKISQGYDVVYGVYNNENYPLYRKLGSKLVDGFFTYGLGKPKNIRVGSYRIINRKTANKILKDNTPFVYITAITMKYTKNFGNVYVSHRERKYGQSNYNFIKLSKVFLNLFYYYKLVPIFNHGRIYLQNIKHSRDYK